MIELRQLKKHYKNVKAVDGIDLTLHEGEIIGLLGPNGAGKSTTISMIATLFTPTSGDIFFNGDSIVKNPRLIQPTLGYIPQELAIYPMLTGYENLKYFGSLYGLQGKELEKRIEETAEIIGITDRLKNKVSEYSGGMKRRINIGVALLHNPRFVIMDEPTVGIDPQSRNHILEAVKKLKEKGVTVLYTTHYMEEVEAICERIHIMDHGKIIASGSKDSLIAQSGIQTSIHFKFEKDVSSYDKSFKQIHQVVAVQFLNEYEVELVITGTTGVRDIVKNVMDRDIKMISFDVKKPNLEQVFLSMTGRALRD